MDIGSKKLHCVVSPNEDAAVTVVFEGGQGETTADWSKVQHKICQEARCISYDRAGLGFSEAGHTKPSAESIVDDLVQLLSHLQVQGPIVIVAHGAGALYSRELVAACSDPESKCYKKISVGGLLLLDPQIEGVKDLVGFCSL